jgi:hypothetical protein
MSRCCFLLAFGLLLFGRPCDSAASIHWEWTSDSLDVVGTIVIDDTSSQFKPGGFLDRRAGNVTAQFAGRNGVPIVIHLFGIFLGPDPASPVGARVSALGGENAFWQSVLVNEGSIFISLVPRYFSTAPPGGVDAMVNAYPELAGPINRSVAASDGVLRVVTPEPATIAVWSLLSAVAGCVYWKRRK